jgi:hypothetical protein
MTDNTSTVYTLSHYYYITTLNTDVKLHPHVSEYPHIRTEQNNAGSKSKLIRVASLTGAVISNGVPNFELEEHHKYKHGANEMQTKKYHTVQAWGQ